MGGSDLEEAGGDSGDDAFYPLSGVLSRCRGLLGAIGGQGRLVARQVGDGGIGRVGGTGANWNRGLRRRNGENRRSAP